jgi:hypothetical protein
MRQSHVERHSHKPTIFLLSSFYFGRRDRKRHNKNKEHSTMAGQSRKWMILIATIWIQAFTGTNFDFSSYSSTMKSVLKISQVQLNYLATASDMGKVFGWSSGLALMYLPISLVMFIAASMGLVGYGLQFLLINNFISLPYFLVSSFFFALFFSFPLFIYFVCGFSLN